MELMVEVVGTVYIWENNVELFSSEDIFFTQLGERMQKIVVGSRRRWPLCSEATDKFFLFANEFAFL